LKNIARAAGNSRPFLFLFRAMAKPRKVAGRFSEWQKGDVPITLCAMRLLDRYLFCELFAPFAYCLIGIQSVIVMITAVGDAEKIQEAKLHFFETIGYAAAASIENITIILPISLLLASLMALTHHGRHNEITAMRAAGISLWRICVPYFIAGLITGAALFALNEMVVPRSLDWSTRLLTRNTDVAKISGGSNKLDFTNDRDHRRWTIADYHAGTGEMTGVVVDWTLEDGSERVLRATAAVRTNGVWTFFNVQELKTESKTYVPILTTNVLAMPEFDETPHEIQNEIKFAKFFDSIELHTLNVPLKDILDYLSWHQNLSRGDKGRLLTEMWDRLAKPWTCFVVVLIAIPFGAAPGRRNLFFGVAGSIFICFAYFVLQHLSLAFGASGSWPAWLAAWLPNLFFAVLGVILIARIR
jgi:lipopolysaccharide export system permease protein